MLHILGIVALAILGVVGALILLGIVLAALILNSNENPFQ